MSQHIALITRLFIPRQINLRQATVLEPLSLDNNKDGTSLSVWRHNSDNNLSQEQLEIVYERDVALLRLFGLHSVSFHWGLGILKDGIPFDTRPYRIAWGPALAKNHNLKEEEAGLLSNFFKEFDAIGCWNLDSKEFKRSGGKLLLEEYSSVCYQPLTTHRLILYCSCLDSLLMLDEEKGDNALKIAMRGAVILESLTDSKEEIFKKLDIAYEKRSKFIHKSEFPRDIDNIVEQLRKYVALTMLFFAQNGNKLEATDGRRGLFKKIQPTYDNRKTSRLRREKSSNRCFSEFDYSSAKTPKDMGYKTIEKIRCKTLWN